VHLSAMRNPLLIHSNRPSQAESPGGVRNQMKRRLPSLRYTRPF